MSVIPMSVPSKVTPKSETRQHNGHYYHLTYDPNAPDGKKWVWRAVVTKKYVFVGDAATLDAASRGAKRKIDKFQRVWGEDDAS
jgi:hypothetical protein